MRFNHIAAGPVTAAELLDEGVVLRTVDDALAIMVASGTRFVILRARQVSPDFFRLATGLAGEILQKFTIYRMRLAIVGDFSPYLTKNFADFIRESNRYGDYLFVETKEEALRRWSKADE
jgi:hypothetical protein